MDNSLYLENPNAFRLNIKSTENETTDLSAAVVNLTLSIEGGADVAGIAWPVVMTFVPGSTYGFIYTLPKTAPIALAQKYIAEVVATDLTSGFEGTFKKRLAGAELYI